MPMEIIIPTCLGAPSMYQIWYVPTFCATGWTDGEMKEEDYLYGLQFHFSSGGSNQDTVWCSSRTVSQTHTKTAFGKNKDSKH